MRNTENVRIKKMSPARLVTLIVAISVSFFMLFAVIKFVSDLAEYNELQDKKEDVQIQINAAKDSIEELEYWIDAPMNDKYIMKFAKEKLELYRADEIVFTNDQRN